jgi:hypothetical protein
MFVYHKEEENQLYSSENTSFLPGGVCTLHSPFLVQKSNQNTWFSATLDFSSATGFLGLTSEIGTK